MTILAGVDFHHLKTVTDWQALANDVQFCVLKTSQGTDFADPAYKARVARARSVGLLVGSYHFADGADAAAEARKFLTLVDHRPGEIVMLDVEGAILSNPALPAWVAEWTAAVHASLGVLPVIYMSASTTRRFDWAPVVKAGCALWLAKYGPIVPPRPAPWPRLALWQHSRTGRPAGTVGAFDMDYFYGDRAAWLALGGAPHQQEDIMDLTPANIDAIAEAVAAKVWGTTATTQNWSVNPEKPRPNRTALEIISDNTAYSSGAEGKAEEGTAKVLAAIAALAAKLGK